MKKRSAPRDNKKKLRIASKSKKIPERSTKIKTKSKRVPRKLTDLRMEKIKKFFVRNYTNPEIYSCGEIGSEEWKLELLNYLNEPAFRRLQTSDVEHWLKTSKEWFKLVRGRAEKKVRDRRRGGEDSTSEEYVYCSRMYASRPESISPSSSSSDSEHTEDDSFDGTTSPDPKPKAQIHTADDKAETRVGASSSGTQKRVEVNVNKDDGSGAAETQEVTCTDRIPGIGNSTVETPTSAAVVAAADQQQAVGQSSLNFVSVNISNMGEVARVLCNLLESVRKLHELGSCPENVVQISTLLAQLLDLTVNS